MNEPARRPRPRGERRILYVSDPSSIATNLFGDPTEPDELRRWVDMLADSGVDTFDQEVYSQGWTAYWRSEKVQYDQRIQHRRFVPMLERGVQPLEVLIDQTHRRGMTFIAGFRVNDNHGFLAVQQGVGIANFIKSHPEWALTEFPEGEYYKLSAPLDFSFDEVRGHLLDVMTEVALRFDVDGLEMCFRDHAYFPVNTGAERAHLMTDLVRRVRAMLDDQGRSEKRKLLLGARVFSTLEECGSLGLDVPTWIGEGLIDCVSPQDVMFADFNAPYHAFGALTRASGCMLYPAVLPWTSHRARMRLDQIPLSAANSRALAQTFYGAGADGISVYNHFCAMWHPPFYPQAMQVFHELRDPARNAAGPRHYIFDPTWAGVTGFGQDRCSTGAVKAQRIVLDRAVPDASGEYRFDLYEDLDRAECATFLFHGFGLTEDDELEVRLNGHLVSSSAISRTRQSDAPVGEWDHVRETAGRRMKCIPEQGRIDFREEREAPLSTRWFRPEPSAAVRGENRLSVRLTDSAPGSSGTIVIDELEVWVYPR